MSWNPLKWPKAAYDSITGAGDAANEQKSAYDQAAGAYSNLGNTAMVDYDSLKNSSLGYYDPVTQAITNQTNNRPTQQQQAFEFAQYQANKPTNDETALNTFKTAADNPTNDETALGTFRDAAGRPTAEENLLANDTYGNNLTDIEQLYQERKGGNDPAAAYQDSRAQRAIDARAAATGGYNSGAGIRNVSDYYANVGAQRSQQLASLAEQSTGAAGNRATYRSGLASGADTSRLNVNSAYGDASNRADTSRLNVNSAYGDAANRADTSRLNVDQSAINASGGASKEESDYFAGITKVQFDEAAAKAGITSDLGTKAIEAYKSGQAASIEAFLVKSGIDAKSAQAFSDTITSGVKSYVQGSG